MDSNKSKNLELIKVAESFQNECHSMVKEFSKENKKLSVQDITNVWLFKKLAEMELRIKKVEHISKFRNFY